MKRLLLLILILLAASPGYAAKKNYLPIGGSYKSTIDDKAKFDLILIQSGKDISGSYLFNNGKFEGTLKDRKVSGKWTEDDAEGLFVFEFSRDGKSFTGKRSVGARNPEKDKDAVDWNGEITVQYGHSSQGGDWVLIDKETFISRPKFTIDHLREYDDGSKAIMSFVYTLAGNAEDFTVGVSCDYHHTYMGVDEAYYNDDVVFSFSEKGGFMPLSGAYGPEYQGSWAQPLEGVFIHKLIGTIPKDYGFYDDWSPNSLYSVTNGYVCLSNSVSIGGFPGVNFEPGHYTHVFDSKYEHFILTDEHRNEAMVFGNQPYKYTIDFPNREFHEGGDDYYVLYEIRFRHGEYGQDGEWNDEVFDYIATVYHFRWNGDPNGWTGTTDTKDWFYNIFGDNAHVDDLWTIFIGGGAAALGIGAIASALSQMGPDGWGGGEGGEVPPTEPADDDRQKSFFRSDDPDYVKGNVKQNSDGTLTLNDPGGGPSLTLYPKYDENGRQVGWFSNNLVDYSDDDIREWCRTRSENAELFQQDTAQAAQNVEEQRLMNEARDQADRERGTTQTAIDLKNDMAKQQLLQKLGDRYGIDPNDTEAIKNALKREQLKNVMEGAQHQGDSAWYDERIAECELAEKTCDIIINTLGESCPAAKVIKTQYNTFKTIAVRTMEGIADDKGAGHLALKVVQGVGDVAITQLQDAAGSDYWKENSKLNLLTGGQFGRTVGSEMLKSVVNDAIEGEDASTILNNATKAGITKYASGKVGDFLGNQVDKAYKNTTDAIDMNASDAIEQLAGNYSAGEMMKSLGSDYLGETLVNPVAEDLSEELSFWRQRMIGV